MYKAILQIILSVALSAGVVSGFNPNIQDRLELAWSKVEALTSQAVDLTSEVTQDLVAKISGQTDVGFEANATTTAIGKVQSNRNSNLITSMESQSFGQAQVETNDGFLVNTHSSTTLNSSTNLGTIFNNQSNGSAQVEHNDDLNTDIQSESLFQAYNKFSSFLNILFGGSAAGN